MGKKFRNTTPKLSPEDFKKLKSTEFDYIPPHPSLRNVKVNKKNKRKNQKIQDELMEVLSRPIPIKK